MYRVQLASDWIKCLCPSVSAAPRSLPPPTVFLFHSDITAVARLSVITTAAAALSCKVLHFQKKRRKCLIIFPPLQVALVAVPTVLGIASIRVYTVREAPADGLVSRDRVRLAVPQHHLVAVSLAVLCLNSPCLSS